MRRVFVYDESGAISENVGACLQCTQLRISQSTLVKRAGTEPSPYRLG
jgi:hypothetical protein